MPEWIRKPLRYLKFPKLLRNSLIILVCSALIFGYASYLLSDSKHKSAQFLSNLFLNVVAEFFGIGLGLIVPLIIASKASNDKLKSLIRVIAKLRKQKVITRFAARGCVMCAAKLISEDYLKQTDISYSIIYKKDNCDVCALPVDISGDNKCEHCDLEDHIWRLDKEPVSTTPSST